MPTDPTDHSTVSDAESNVQGGGGDVWEYKAALFLILAKMEHPLEQAGESCQDDSVSRTHFPLGHHQHVRGAEGWGGHPIGSCWQ